MENLPVHQGDLGLKYTNKRKSFNHTQTEEEREEPPDIREQLLLILKYQPQACDIMWSLFYSAAESYKCDSLLRPFPRMFIDQFGDKDVHTMRRVANSIPGVMKMLEKLESNTADLLQVQLMHFVLIQSKTFRLRAVNKTEFRRIIEKVQNWGGVRPPPDFIFELDYSQRASSAKFNALIKTYGARYGFHGSRLENFYSILHHGLQASLNKVAAFGPGVYLSGEVHVSMTYSPTGMSWEESMFGEKLSVIALCQMVDHPDVKCQDERISERKYAGSFNEVPKKYFVVQNSDLVRVTHLMVYSQRRSLSHSTSNWHAKLTYFAIFIGLILVLNLWAFVLKRIQS